MSTAGSFCNATPYAAVAVPYVAPDGREVVIAIVKATFSTVPGRGLELADAQRPIRLVDVLHYPEAEQSSVRHPGDVCVAKCGTDLVVNGEAISRRPVAAVDVAVSVRELVAPLRVHGERVFYRGAMGVAVGPAALFERKPIVYERAWGGASQDCSVMDRRNPVGRGVARSAAELVDQPAPQIEHPANPIRGAERHEPAGYGAIPASWSPRADLCGTADEAWKSARMPLMPRDYDLRAANVAHPSLQIDPPLRAGETIRVLAMSEDGLWQAALPDSGLVIRARFADASTEVVRPFADMVLVEPAEGVLELGFRASFAMGRGKRVLREIQVDTDA
jgi:hypothetical protein